ncbi:MAG: BREX system ATP-binding domain-containing protein [Pseudomonadota bacterium]
MRALFEHLIESLRKGLVPERGIDAFAVGIEKQRGELHRQLELAADGEGTIKFLRGGYGCGKTFMARLALLDAQARGFATSFMVVSDNDLRFHRFDDVYRKVMTELGTASCPRGALGDVLDRWIGQLEGGLNAGGADPEAPDFDAAVRRLDDDLASLTGGKAPQDFVRVIQAIFDLKQQGELFPAADRAHLEALIPEGFVARLVAEVTTGFRGDVGVVPRQFLRQFVNAMDLCDEHDDYVPDEAYEFTPPADLTPEEQHAISGAALAVPEDDDGGLVPQEDIW